ncbi:MAG: T9SS type A sorting domain-containing protein [Flavobacterium sp.]|nr:T9SS type A sorting domain-containing protein [Flavobacterium sp.]
MIKNYLIVSLLCSFFGFSQFNSKAPWMANSSTSRNEATIDELVTSFNQYWLTRDKNARGSGYKPFMRWEYHWRNYTNEQGYIMSSADFWEAWRLKNQSRTNRNNSSLPVSNWQPIGPFTHTNTGSWSSGQGRVNIVHVDPSNSNVVYLGAPAGGIWKSINNGSTWTPLTDELPQIGVSGIAVDYSNSNVIYIATGDKDAGDSYSVGVYKSTDGGLTWNPTGVMGSSNPSSAGDLVIHPTNNQILWCATNNGIYKTTNAGNTWSQVQSGDFAQGNIRLKSGDPTTIYAVSNNRFFRSTDTGSTFTQISTGLPNSSSRLLLDVTSANASYIYILSAATDGSMQGIYRSTDGGSNWTKTSSNETVTAGNVFESTQAWYDLALAVSPTNADEIYTGCLNVWKSTDGGVSVTKMNNWSSPAAPSYTHADIHYLGFHGNKLFCGSDGGIYVSSNGGTNFTDLTAGVQISQFYKIAVSKQSAANMVGGLQDNGGHAYSSGQWKNYYGADGMDTAINPNNPNQYYGFIQSGGNLYISNNAGNGLSGSVPSPGVDGNWVTPLAINNAGLLFAGYNNLYKLVSGAWVQQNSNSVGSGNIELISIDPSNDNIMYVANGSNLYKSTDLGINFTIVHTASSAITSIEVHSSDSNIIYLTTQSSSGGVFKSTNGGTSFSSFSTGLPSIGKNIIVHQGRNTDNPLYLGTNLGVFYRDDTMTQWEPFDTNLPNVSVTDLEINVEDAKLIAATYGRGIWQTNIPIEIPANDVKFVNIQSPGIDLNCNATITPQVVVKNNGTNAISSVTVNYSIDTGATNSYVWNGTIPANNNTTIDLPSSTLTRGVHTLNVTTTISSDAYSDNNSGSTTFYINDSGTIGQVNPFTSTSNELISYNEGGQGSQWVRGVRTSGIMNSSGNSVYTTNLTGNYPDMIKSYLVSQCYNLSNVTNPQISFAMKYDLEENWDIVYVQYSTNFGATWNVLGNMTANWYNSDRTPTTTGSDCNNCPGAQWTGTSTALTTYSYPLNSLNTETNIIFRIVFHSDDAENKKGVNVDDFVISGTLSSENFELNNVFIYPNPSKGMFNISLGNLQPTGIEVYDLTGKKVYEKKEVTISNFETKIDLSNVTQGIYFVKIIDNNQSTVKRIIKE